ncbi:MAG: hypothetical protein IH957_05725 [Chloroflexi bacterium]|nr:hypothetical protein [Chloroflexota bacterium]
MAIDAITKRNDGSEVVPNTDADWQDWVSASKTRNFAEQDPLLDWLNEHGVGKGFQRDDELPDYDERTDFLRFLFAKGIEFESAVLAHLQSSIPITVIAEGPRDIRSIARARDTFEAMETGEKIIAQGVLWNPDDQTYGAPDLLVRSDVLRDLFPDSLTAEEASVRAPDLGHEPWHYRVVDVKFTTLDLDKYGHEKKAHTGYMAQTFIYNEALGRLQGFLPQSSYLLGRGWKTSSDRGRSCMERLSRVDQDGAVPLRSLVASAVEWIRRVRRDGADWEAIPEPSTPELRPNMSNTNDYPWHAAKQQIAAELEELTSLWMVGVNARSEGNAKDIYRWSDPRCSAANLGVTGTSRPFILDQVIEVNRSQDGLPVQRGNVSASAPEWHEPAPVEFYVDFETVNNLNDDFSRIPDIGGQELIFMIGCGHIEDGEWQFRCFVASDLTEPSEVDIIDEWFTHMADVTRRMAAEGCEPLVFHWSPAETITLETAYRSAKARHPDKDWPEPKWFDLLKNVVKTEPIVVRGAMGFSLKAIAQAMHTHGLIETIWGDGPADGLGAMVGAWHCHAKAREQGKALQDVQLMKVIAEYNEVDCKVMMEILSFLREEKTIAPD